MRYQSRQATCGAVGIVNALGALDHSVTEDQVAAASGLRDLTRGLGEREIKRALTSLGYGHSEIWVAQEPHGWLFLRDELAHGHPVILVVDNDRHWVTAIGTLGKLVQVADGAHADLVSGKNREQLMKSWGSECRRPYYGIAVIPPEVRK